MGGAWGTHAALHSTPKYFYLYYNLKDGTVSTPEGTVDLQNLKLNIRTKQTTAKTTSSDAANSSSYMQYVQTNKNNKVPGVFFDRYWNNLWGGTGDGNTDTGASGWSFEQGSGDSEGNRTYRLYQTVENHKYYLVALTTDIDQYGDDVEAKQTDTPADKYGKNAEWKLISMKQYNELFSKAPAALSEPTDASFLLSDPDFSVNSTDLKNWHTEGEGPYWFGTANYRKTTTADKDAQGKKIDYSYTKQEGLDKGGYQTKYGRFFNALIYSANGEIWQGVTVTKPGWYLFRCRGISNVNAVLYAQQCNENTYATVKTVTQADNTTKSKVYTSQALNNYPEDWNPQDKMLAAGQEFAKGKYENQVMLYVEPQKKENGEDVGTYYIRFGIKVGDRINTVSTTPSSAKALRRSSPESFTIFDSFRMLYAGEPTTPDLILDEDNTDLYYLTANGKPDGTDYTSPVDTYTNTTLHLNRTFSLGKWNTIILPVDLTYAQMKAAFGDNVKLAYLNALTDNTMRFVTVEPKTDDAKMLEANKPYIILPTKGPGTTPSYTATLHHSNDTQNQVLWTGTYQGKDVTGGKITIGANHYVIQKVTLDKTNINTTAWVPTNSCTATNNNGTMTTQGTLAQTYETGTTSIISGREKCKGSYIMKNGAFYLVPEEKEYGLKAFRTWFKYTPTSAGSKPTTFSFFINDEEVPATAIQNLFVDEPAARMSNIPGVYSLSGERLRLGNDLTGLPSGIYIVNGQKYVIK